MKANLDIENVSSFSKDIERQRETVSEMSSQLNGMADEASAQIQAEQAKAAEAIEKCSEGLAKLSNQINELNEKISELSSKLSTIPPKIKKKYVDKDGNEYTVEEDNPEYISLQSQIALLQNQLQQLMNLSNQIDGIKRQLSNQSDLLSAGVQQISQINSSIMGCNNNIGGLSSEAVSKLGQIHDVLQEYKSVKIQAPSLAGVGKRGIGIWENIAPPNPAMVTDTPKSAMQKMADYMRKHDYGMGDKDKYMQDPEWIALNDALQKEVKEQERVMEERMDVKTPTNPNGLEHLGSCDNCNDYDDHQWSLSDHNCNYGNGDDYHDIPQDENAEEVLKYLPKTINFHEECNKVISDTWNKTKATVLLGTVKVDMDAAQAGYRTTAAYLLNKTSKLVVASSGAGIAKLGVEKVVSFVVDKVASLYEKEGKAPEGVAEGIKHITTSLITEGNPEIPELLKKYGDAISDQSSMYSIDGTPNYGRMIDNISKAFDLYWESKGHGHGLSMNEIVLEPVPEEHQKFINLETFDYED